MERAQRRDAVHGEKFYFPRTTFPTQLAAIPTSSDSEITEMDLDTIFNGNVSKLALTFIMPCDKHNSLHVHRTVLALINHWNGLFYPSQFVY